MTTAITALGGAKVPWSPDGVMTGTAKLDTEEVELDALVSDVSWEASWTNGTDVLGNFGVEFRNGDKPWVPGVEDTDFFIVGPDVNNNNGAVVVHCKARTGQARLTYLNISGTGTLNPNADLPGKKN